MAFLLPALSRSTYKFFFVVEHTVFSMHLCIGNTPIRYDTFLSLAGKFAHNDTHIGHISRR